MATATTKTTAAELKALLEEVSEANIEAKIAEAEKRLKQLRHVRDLLGVGADPKPRTKKDQQVAGTVDDKKTA